MIIEKQPKTKRIYLHMQKALKMFYISDENKIINFRDWRISCEVV